MPYYDNFNTSGIIDNLFNNVFENFLKSILKKELDTITLNDELNFNLKDSVNMILASIDLDATVKVDKILGAGNLHNLVTQTPGPISWHMNDVYVANTKIECDLDLTFVTRLHTIISGLGYDDDRKWNLDVIANFKVQLDSNFYLHPPSLVSDGNKLIFKTKVYEDKDKLFNNLTYEAEIKEIRGEMPTIIYDQFETFIKNQIKKNIIEQLDSDSVRKKINDALITKVSPLIIAKIKDLKINVSGLSDDYNIFIHTGVVPYEEKNNEFA